MKRINYSIVITVLMVFGITNACKDTFTEITPNGALDVAVLATAEGVDGLLIGAYSMLDGQASQGFGWQSATSGWVFASIRGLVANKGTDSGDQPDINPIQQYSETATNPYLNIKWRATSEGISRCNNVITVAAAALML